jgi:HAD superfamily hydrolase (TIGR01509 family)
MDGHADATGRRAAGDVSDGARATPAVRTDGGDDIDGDGDSGDAGGDETPDDAADGRSGRPAAVLFDMDGVLVDSERYWAAFEAEFYPEAVAGERVAREETTGMNYRDIYRYLDEEYGTTVTESAFVERYESAAERVYREQVSLLDGAGPMVDAVREAGYRVAVVSSSPLRWIRWVVERFDLGPFDELVSAEEFDGPGKPAPDVYEHAAAELGVSPRECVVVEDSVNGVRAGAAAGASTVGYRGPDAADPDLDLAAAGADVVVEGPADLRAELGRRLGLDL